MNKNRELIAILRGLTLDRCIVVGKILIAAGFTKLEVPLNSTNPMETILAMKNSIVPPNISINFIRLHKIKNNNQKWIIE